jgi:glycosyltransferase involved in cell wall biosynthesis
VVVAVTMVKDEADIIEYTVEHMAAQVDRVLVCDNGSTDGTAGIIAALAAAPRSRVSMFSDRQLAYLQGQKITRLAMSARQAFDAEWIVPFDADEVFVGPKPLVELLADERADVLTCQWVDHVTTGVDPGEDPNPLTRMGWRRPNPSHLPKIICRWRPGITIAQGNHSVRYTGGHRTAVSRRIVVHHFPYRSPDQMRRKIANGVAAYQAAGSALPRGAGAHWKQLGERLAAEGPSAADREFQRHWRVGNPTGTDLVYDPIKAPRRA